MPRILYPQWRESLQPTKYPFADTATLTNAANEFIPDDLFLDASFYVIGAREGLHLSEIEINNSTATLRVSDTTQRIFASAAFELFDPPEIIRFVDSYERPAGVLVSTPNQLSVLQAWSPGVHTFLRLATQFAASVVIPTPEPGVRGFQLADGTLFTGDVWLVAEEGVVLTSTEQIVEASCGEPESTQIVVRVDVVGDPLFRRRVCDPLELFQAPQFLQKLKLRQHCVTTELVPDARGDVKLTVGSHQASDTALRLRPTPQGLLIEVVGDTISS